MSEGQQPSVGSVGEEAAKLLNALQDWTKETSGAYAASVTEDLGEHLSGVGAHLGHGEDCRYCPLCQGLRVFRETSPEVRQHLVAAVGSLAQAVSAYLNGAGTADSERGESPQRIDLDDD